MTLEPDVKKRWDRVAQRLRAELGEDLYTSWFARMEIEELSSGRLVVSVPTRFLKFNVVEICCYSNSN
jgi:chromosomal replication initiator protein